MKGKTKNSVYITQIKVIVLATEFYETAALFYPCSYTSKIFKKIRSRREKTPFIWWIFSSQKKNWRSLDQTANEGFYERRKLLLNFKIIWQQMTDIVLFNEIIFMNKILICVCLPCTQERSYPRIDH